MSLTIKYLDTPEGAQTSATVTGVGLQPFSAATSMATGADDVAWATTEPGMWLLDGSRDILPDDPQNVGWWSAYPSMEAREGFILGKGILGVTPLGTGSRDGERTFETPPMLIIDFSSRFSATGLTIKFSPSTNQWCSHIRIKWYRGEELLAEGDERLGSPEWDGGGFVDSFDRITIEILETSEPGHLAKIQQIVVGKLIVFGREEIASAQLVNEVDHTLGTLPVDVSRYEVYAPEDLLLNPQQNQRVELYRDNQLLASHYIESGARTAAGCYVLNCQSAIGRLESDFMGNVYEEVPASDLIGDILLDGDFKFYIHPDLARATVTGYIAPCTRREALQQICFAIGAMASTSKSDVINFMPIPEAGDGKFGNDDVFPGTEIETTQRVAYVEVTSHRFKKSSEIETLLEDEEIDGEDVLFIFDAPHWGYDISGGSITGDGANWITVTASGLVTVTAKTYAHTTTVRRKKNPDATYAERGNVVSITEATLVNSANVREVLDRVFDASVRCHTLTQDAIISDQTIGDYVTSVSTWGGTVTGIITSMDSTLTQGGHIARVVISGKEAT